MVNLREEAERKMQGLIDGELTPTDASKWAEDTYFYKDNKQIIDKSPSLSDLFDSLIMSSMTHDGVKPMYDIVSFKEWLEEYKQGCKEEGL